MKVAGAFFSAQSMQPFAAQMYFAEDYCELTVVHEEVEKKRRLAYSFVKDFQILPDVMKLTFVFEEKGEESVFEFPAQITAADFLKSKLVKKAGFVLKLRTAVSSMSVKSKLGLAAALLLISAGVYYIILFQSYRLVPVSADEKLGRQMSSLILNTDEKPYSAEITAEFTSLAGAVYSNLYPEKTVMVEPKFLLTSQPVLNALALPNGSIIFFGEMIEFCEDFDSFAGITAHEMAHLEKRHQVRQIIRVLGVSAIISSVIGGGIEGFEGIEASAEILTSLLTLSYTRTFEAEADETALKRLHQAAWSVKGFKAVFEKIQDLENISTYVQSAEKPGSSNANDTNRNFLKKWWDKINTQTNREKAGKAGEKVVNIISTHPNPKERIKKIQAQLDKEGVSVKIRDDAEYQKLRKRYIELRKKVIKVK